MNLPVRIDPGHVSGNLHVHLVVLGSDLAPSSRQGLVDHGDKLRLAPPFSWITTDVNRAGPIGQQSLKFVRIGCVERLEDLVKCLFDLLLGVGIAHCALRSSWGG